MRREECRAARRGRHAAYEQAALANAADLTEGLIVTDAALDEALEQAVLSAPAIPHLQSLLDDQADRMAIMRHAFAHASAEFAPMLARELQRLQAQLDRQKARLSMLRARFLSDMAATVSGNP